MSVLTRVFVVLLSFASVALSMLVMAAFAEQQEWKSAAQGYQAAASAEQAKAATFAANLALLQQRSVDQQSQHESEINTKNRSIAKLEEQQNQLTRDKTQAGNQFAAEQAQATSLGDSLRIEKEAASRLDSYAKQLEQRNSELTRRNVDLSDRVEGLTTSVALASAQVRALQQQIESMEQGQVASAAGGRSTMQIPGGGGIVEAHVPSVEASQSRKMSAPIRGTVTDVRGDLASVSVGSSDGVAPGMTFLVYRPSENGKSTYLGTIRIERVTANESAGRIEQSDGEIRPGDSARDEASFAMR